MFGMNQLSGFNANFSNTGGTSMIFNNIGALWSWGNNTYGQLGLGNRTSYSSPVQVGSLTNWTCVANGLYHSLALQSDGSAWVWGNNTYGQLGLGNRTSYSSPVQVSGTYSWIACTDTSSFLIKNNGTLWGCGQNTNDQLGQGNNTSYSSPVQIGSDTKWMYISGGGNGAITAVKTDGTIWGCGQNNNGQLGMGNTTNPISRITQVGSDTSYIFSSTTTDCSAVIKNDGSLWTFGNNNNGQLGTNNKTSYSTPTQVSGTPSGDTWIFVSMGHNDNCSAVRNDFTLWSWGNGSNFALGQGNSSNYSVPTQVGIGTNWVYCDNSWSPSGYGIGQDGTLWSWGENAAGQLGLGTTTDYTTPAQVGSSVNWLYSKSYNDFVLAIRQS